MLASSDPATAAGFYSGLFGWADAAVDGSTVFTQEGLAVAGLTPTAAAGQPSAWLTYISTEDVAADAESVTASGGTVLLPPTEVGPRGRMALFADPEGAVFGVWQRGTFAGAQLVNEHGAVCWSEVATRDTAAAAGFYGKVFGWSERQGEAAVGFDYREWVIQGRVVGGMSPMGEQFPAEVPAHWRTTFEVDDCATLSGRCTALGGQVVFGPMDVGVGQYAQFIDPSGGAFGVIELVPELRLGR